jgi:hypothetical protein
MPDLSKSELLSLISKHPDFKKVNTGDFSHYNKEANCYALDTSVEYTMWWLALGASDYAPSYLVNDIVGEYSSFPHLK